MIEPGETQVYKLTTLWGDTFIYVTNKILHGHSQESYGWVVGKSVMGMALLQD